MCRKLFRGCVAVTFVRTVMHMKYGMINRTWRYGNAIAALPVGVAPEEAHMSFAGRWEIVSSTDFDDDYLQEEVTPYITLKQAGKRITGNYHVGLQQGGIDGRLQSTKSVFFSFEGMDEHHEVNGAGTLTLHGDRLTFVLMYHQGDDYTFECERRD